MALAQIQIIPVGTDTASFSSFVAACQNTLDQQGIKHQLTPTATVVEGSLEQVLGAVKSMHELTFQNGAARVVTNLSIDERRDKTTSMEDAVQSVLQNGH